MTLTRRIRTARRLILHPAVVLLIAKRKLIRGFRVAVPSLVFLAFAGAAHAQGTIDFSGAQTLMGTFKTFAMYAGAVMHDERSISTFFLSFLLARCMRTQADLVDQLFNNSEKRLARILLLMAEFRKSLLIEQLEAGHSDALTNYLTAMSRFHTYSIAANIKRIHRCLRRPHGVFHREHYVIWQFTELSNEGKIH